MLQFIKINLVYTGALSTGTKLWGSIDGKFHGTQKFDITHSVNNEKVICK